MEGRKLYGAFPAFTHVSVRWTGFHRKSLLFYHLVLTSRQSHSLEAVSLKGTWFVIRIYCQGEKVPSPTQMPGRGRCQTVTGPSFSATVIALCTGGKMPGQLLGKLPAALQGPKLWGNFRLKMGGRKRTSPRGPRHLPGVTGGEIVKRHCSFLFHKWTATQVTAEQRPSRGDNVSNEASSRKSSQALKRGALIPLSV